MRKFGVLNSERDMNIEDFKREIDAMFPCKWIGNFLRKVRSLENQLYTGFGLN